jgi:thiamine pyrophosphate-dependent acetolactate synthase large subunit-like protein
MLTMAEFLEPLARRRSDEVVVTTMSAVRPWGRLSSHDLDFASADSAMGHAADLALGIALARPERRVICLNGDGSLAMSLGTLLTAVDCGVTNFALVTVENGTYEITGNQPVPAAGCADLAAMARAAGFALSAHVGDAETWLRRIDDVLSAPGPVFVSVSLEARDEGPLRRSPTEEARYLRTSLAEWSRTMREALQPLAASVRPPPHASPPTG